MPWYSKEQPTPFDSAQIPGLEYLHGDVLAKQFRQFWVEGKKYPLISFPSGIRRELRPTSQDGGGGVHIFDGLEIPYIGDRDAALRVALKLAEVHGYSVNPVGRNGLKITNPYTARSYELTFDEAVGHLANIVLYPNDVTELLDGATRALLPPLAQIEKLGLDVVAPIKFFTPVANWTWYPAAFDGDDIFWGLVSGYEVEYGIFSLSELEEIGGSLSMPVERDLQFVPKRLRELEKLHLR